ncbi:MAG: DeoR/GlpR transcriptional regulator [Clostridia bacterium]|nr:DeoR/GlpR transcriptional regulator [Clostridia bacterium]
MHRAIRKDEILELLKRYNYMTVPFLAKTLHISQSSVRRDLAVMETQGLVKRTHGGVSEVESSNTLAPYSLRMQENSIAKRAICTKAASLIQDGDVVFIDGSTTCLFLPELIEQKRNITVLTNSLRLAAMFKNNNVQVYCTGGSLRLQDEYVMAGPMAEDNVRKMRTDWMFFSARAIDEQGVITDLNEPETSLRQVAMAHTEKAVFLCDSSKFNRKSLFTLCNSEDLYGIISDVQLPEPINKKEIL